MIRTITHTGPRPFVKWAGGKTQLLNTLDEMMPIEYKNGKPFNYIEPFVGSGAMLFHILRNYNVNDVYINDNNYKLMMTYKVLKDNPDALIGVLTELKNGFMNTKDKNRYFLVCRDQFNNDSIDDLDLAALFIFLNKTCFNGLYRENKKGDFNVPFGKYENPYVFDPDSLLADSELLQDVVLINGDYEDTMQFVDDNTFIYFDPPYKPLNLHRHTFNGYTRDKFDDYAQKRLKGCVDDCTKIGAKVMLSNSDPDCDFFDELYKGYRIDRVSAKRHINSRGDGRGAVSEIVVRNYDY